MSEQWDEFTKSLSEPVPRRESLRRLGAVFAGALFGAFGAKNALGGPNSDPCKAFCRCRNKSQQSQCIAACRDCNSDPRFLCGSCGGYACTDLGSDIDNCGACFNFCDDPGPYEYAACINGRCEYGCISGTVRCDGKCTDLDWDVANCGACGNVCEEPGSNEYSWCENGRCEYLCHEGADYCDGRCTFLNSDPDNCGMCGNICGGSTPYCHSGECTAGNEPCPGGGTRCNGVCTNLAFDTLNCGGCGIRCGYGETCSGGICQSPW